MTDLEAFAIEVDKAYKAAFQTPEWKKYQEMRQELVRRGLERFKEEHP